MGVIVTIFLGIGLASAGDPPPNVEPVSLETARLEAQKRHPLIEAARGARDATTNMISAATAGHYPNLDVTGSYTHGFSGSYGALGLHGFNSLAPWFPAL